MWKTKYNMKNLNAFGAGRELILKVMSSLGSKNKNLVKQQDPLSSKKQELPKGTSTPRSKFAAR